MKLTGFFAIFFILVAVEPFAQAQTPTLDQDVLDSLDQGDSSSRTLSADDFKLPDENFTGTLDDEDEDNPEYEQYKKEKELFEDEDGAGGDQDYNDEEGPAYLLKFNYDSQVVFSDKEGNPYLEINYNTKIEQEVLITKRRLTSKGEAQFESEIVGALAGNDLFTCKLDILIEAYPVEIATRLKHRPETEEEDESFELALSIKFEKAYKEDWFSNCLGSDGSQLNSQGDPEKYNIKVLENTSPSLNTIQAKDFLPDDENEIELVTDPILIDDEDLGETIMLTGSGTVTLEPL